MLNLNFGLKQSKTLTPQLKQAVFLLQMPTQALQQYLEEALNSNPFLEADEKKPPTVEIYESFIPYTPSYGKAEPSGAWEADYVAGESLKDHLEWQLELSGLAEEEREIALVIIDSIDDDGFLKTAELDIAEEALLPVLARIQQFDPIGVAARSISECLLLQLNQLPESTSFKEQAAVIIGSHLKKLALRDYKFLQKVVALNEEGLQKAISLIQSLNPRPGGQFSKQDTQYVVPDVILDKTTKGWVVRLNESVLPKLSINQELAAMVKNKNADQEHKDCLDQLQEANLLIKSIQNRQETLLKVSQYIVQQQENFFNHGVKAMKPMILKEIEDVLGFHESTISRTTTEKYMLTPSGIYELNYFFSSHAASDNGYQSKHDVEQTTNPLNI